MINQLNNLTSALKTSLDLWRVKKKFLPKGRRDIHGPFDAGNNLTAFLSYLLFVYFNPLHYGQWIKKFPQKNNSLIDIEIKLFSKLINLFGGKTTQWTGLTNSGASQGNLYALISCKEWLLGQGYKEILLLHNQLTHHSITSSAKILELNLCSVALDQKWQMDLGQVKKQLLKLKKDQAAIVFLTWGYKKSGTTDDLYRCQQLINELKLTQRVLICLDAAFDGLVIPFSNSPIHPLVFPSLFAITFDFHKYLGVPAPAGGVILRKKMVSQDKFTAQGLTETKSLLPSIAAWSTIRNDFLVNQLRIKVMTAQFQRSMLINHLNNISQIDCVYSPNNISLLFSCNQKLFKKLQSQTDNYPIRCFKQQNKFWIKIIFLPQMTQDKTLKLINFIDLNL